MSNLRLIVVVLIASVAALAQQAPPPETGTPQAERGQRGRMGVGFGQGTAGNITAINGDTLTIKTMNGVETVKTTADTMFRRNRDAAKLSDFKIGDTVFVAGEKSGDNWTARIVAMRSGPGMFNPDDLGKKFILGEVTKIDGTKLTIKRPDNVEQTIEVDDDTSFRNSRRESVTLADVKVGDRVGGRGSLKDGTFVPTVLTVGLPERMMMFAGPNDEAPAAANNAPKQEKKQ
jgi:Cu/Ag efflux protein CusF